MTISMSNIKFIIFKNSYLEENPRSRSFLKRLLRDFFFASEYTKFIEFKVKKKIQDSLEILPSKNVSTLTISTSNIKFIIFKNSYLEENPRSRSF